MSGIDQECILLRSLLRVCTSNSEAELAVGRAVALGGTSASKVATLRSSIEEATGWKDQELNEKLQEHADANPHLLYGVNTPQCADSSSCEACAVPFTASGKKVRCGACEKLVCITCAPSSNSVLIPARSLHNKQRVCSGPDCLKGRRFLPHFHDGAWEEVPFDKRLTNAVGKRLSLSSQHLHWWSCCGNRDQRSRVCCGCGLTEYHQGLLAGNPPETCKPASNGRSDTVRTSCALMYRLAEWIKPTDQHTCSLLSEWIYDRRKNTHPSPHDVPCG
jgi:hypothetical protein